MRNRGYEKISVGKLTEELEQAIDTLLDHINTGSGTSGDYYRTEIDCCVKHAKRMGKISDEQYDAVKSYYVYGGIHETKGHPRGIEIEE